jgi:hypothetical protein
MEGHERERKRLKRLVFISSRHTGLKAGVTQTDREIHIPESEPRSPSRIESLSKKAAAGPFEKTDPFAAEDHFAEKESSH